MAAQREGRVDIGVCGTLVLGRVVRTILVGECPWAMASSVTASVFGAADDCYHSRRV
jgi:hypothetical protein